MVQPGGDVTGIAPRSTRQMHAGEVPVDAPLVRSLIAAQFPHWGRLDLEPIPSTGTDNAIFRLGSEMGVRLPRIHWAIPQVDKEWTWLPRLAPHLPVAVPVPLAMGKPGLGYRTRGWSLRGSREKISSTDRWPTSASWRVRSPHSCGRSKGSAPVTARRQAGEVGRWPGSAM